MSTDAPAFGGPFLLGVDGGGSKTTALVARPDGAILGRGGAGPSNYQQVGPQAAFAALEAAASTAFGDARLAAVIPAVVCLGLAGAAREEDRALVRAWAERRFPGAALLLKTDGDLVLTAGTPEGWGVALICGTGSIVIGADREGRRARVGGWGPILGDEGSGYAIGRAALQATMRAYDGRGEPTVLLERVLGHWNLAEPPSLVRRVYREEVTPADIAGLAPLVNRAAEEGDAVAAAILGQAGTELALAVSAAAKALHFDALVPCALAGGLILNSTGLRAAFLDAAQRAGLRLDPVTPVTVPALGAIRLAQQALAME